MCRVVTIDHSVTTLIVDNNEEKLRLDSYIAEKCNISRSKAQKLIQNKQVRLLDYPIINNNHVVKPGEEYTVHLLLPSSPISIESNHDIKLDIIHEDEDIIVLNKQSGLTVHPGNGTSNDTLLNAVIAHLGKVPYDHARPGIVHRLDKDTSGLMVIAKNEDSHSFLSTLLANREIKREYLAVVWGVLSTQHGTIKTNIAPKRNNKEMMCVTKTIGKSAITHYFVQKIIGPASLVKCVLETGRTHQIRVHMSHIGHSIVGDQVYGKNSSKSMKYTKNSSFIRNFNRQALHAYKLGLYHPKSKEYIEFNSDLPQDIEILISECENI
ncbi:RluA family pseudouridine synthase [Wolbachia endosymbiont of Folsomia candida]|uniref:RluA family pseudouridine synthase n=1 Tax=Wolbachia endosymbiont of Folsomia candida TaxID=169402 RepID=UPI000A62CB54|nr:RluA family pseudouridine synthase [Wolbachia endosymbiont of Folsomia candida]APR98214.1 RluA family pseudouridine synthase [Wolbachia endosymbiont of Folsomia candida]